MENCPVNRHRVVALRSVLTYPADAKAIPWQSQDKELLPRTVHTVNGVHDYTR